MLSKSANKSRESRRKLMLNDENIKQTYSVSFHQPTLVQSPQFGSIPSTMRPSSLRSRIIDQSISYPSSPSSSISFVSTHSVEDVEPFQLSESTLDIAMTDSETPNGIELSEQQSIPHDFNTCVLCNISLTQTEDDQVPFLHFFDLLCIVFEYLPITQVFRMGDICPQWKRMLSFPITQQSIQVDSDNEEELITLEHQLEHSGDPANWRQSMSSSSHSLNSTDIVPNAAESVLIPPYAWQAIEDTVTEFEMSESHRHRGRHRGNEVDEQHAARAHSDERVRRVTFIRARETQDTTAGTEEKTAPYFVASVYHSHEHQNRGLVPRRRRRSDTLNFANDMDWTDDSDSTLESETKTEEWYQESDTTWIDPQHFNQVVHHSRLQPRTNAESSEAHSSQVIPPPVAPPGHGRSSQLSLTSVWPPARSDTRRNVRLDGDDDVHFQYHVSDPASIGQVCLNPTSGTNSSISISPPCIGVSTPFTSSLHGRASDRSFLHRITSTSLSTSPYSLPPLSEDMIASLVNLVRIHLYSPFNPTNLPSMDNMQFLVRMQTIHSQDVEFVEMWKEHNEGTNRTRDTPKVSSSQAIGITPNVIHALRNRRAEVTQAHLHVTARSDHGRAHRNSAGPRDIVPGLLITGNQVLAPDPVNATNEQAAQHIEMEDPPGILEALAMHMYMRHAGAAQRRSAKPSPCSFLVPAASHLQTLIFTPDSMQADDLVAIAQLVSLTSLTLLASSDTVVADAFCYQQMLTELRNLKTLQIAGSRNTFALNFLRELRCAPQLTTFALHMTAEVSVADAKMIVDSLPNLTSLTLSSHWPICNQIADLLSKLKLVHLELHVQWSTSFELPRNIFYLITLESLVLYGALATTQQGLPRMLMNLVNLTSLSIRGCFDSLNAIVDVVIGMTKIVHLDFTDSPLTSRYRERLERHRPDIMLKFGSISD